MALALSSGQAFIHADQLLILIAFIKNLFVIIYEQLKFIGS